MMIMRHELNVARQSLTHDQSVLTPSRHLTSMLSTQVSTAPQMLSSKAAADHDISRVQPTLIILDI
jgi:hypothetical protein